MHPKVMEYLNKAKALWGARSISQQMIIGGLTAILTAAFVVGMVLMNKPDFKVL